MHMNVNKWFWQAKTVAMCLACIVVMAYRGLADTTYTESSNSTNGKMSGAEYVGTISTSTLTINGKTALPSDQDWYKITSAGAKLSWTASRLGPYATESSRSSIYLYDSSGSWVANILSKGYKEKSGTCNVTAGATYYVVVQGDGNSDHIQSYSVALSSSGSSPTPTTYTVTYKPGSYGTGSQQTATKTKDVSLTLKGAIYTRSGYTQTGWSTSDGGSKAYSLYASFSGNYSITLYPYWTQNAATTYTVTYKPGAYGTGSQQTATKTKDVALTLKGAIYTRSGYTQTGWSTSDGGSKAYSLYASYSGNYSITLYPYWTSDCDEMTVYIRFNSGGGSGSMSTVTKRIDSCTAVSYTLPECQFSKTGYTFAGWDVYNACEIHETNPIRQPGYTIYELCGDLTLTATWKYVPQRPGNDDFSSATYIYGKSGSATGTTIGATSLSGEPLPSFRSSATNTVWWAWTAPSSGSVTFDTANTSFDTVMGVYTGSSIYDLFTIDQDDDGGPDRTSSCTFEAETGVTYYIAISGYGNSNQGQVYLSWVLEDSRPDLCFSSTVGLPLWSQAVFVSNTADATSGTKYFTLGEPIYLYARFMNNGSAAISGNYKIRHELYFTATVEGFGKSGTKGTLMGSTTYECTPENGEWLASGESRHWNGSLFSMLQNHGPGRYVYECTLDPEGAVDESDESNNTETFSFTIFDSQTMFYEARFHKNDGSDDVTAEQGLEYGVPTRLTSLAKLGWEKRGFDFLGWGKYPTSTVVWQKNWANVDDLGYPGNTIDLYAIWGVAPDSYAIEYWRNDGAGTWRWVGFKHGVKTRMPSVANGLKWGRRGYAFMGWELTTADANDNTRAAPWKGDWAYVATPTKAGTMLPAYARWALKPGYYQIRFNKNDGTGKWRTLGFQVDASTKLSTIAGLGWERPGYTFKGWASNAANAAAGKVWKTDGEWVKNAAAEGRTLSIYAIWE